MRDAYNPVNASTGPVRSSKRSTNLNSAKTISPISTRSGRSLAPTPSKTFSPYARRTRKEIAEEEEEERDEISVPLKNQQSGGLFGGIRSLPGKALGYLFSRSSSTRSLVGSSSSMMDLSTASAYEEENSLESTGASKGRGLPFQAQAISSDSARNDKGRGMMARSYASTNDLAGSNNDFQPPPPPRSTTRSAHSTLAIPASAGPKYQSSRVTRGASPFNASTTSELGVRARNRSASPTRRDMNGSSASAFGYSNILPSSSSTVFTAPLQQHQQTNSYGLTSRSPFARSPSVSNTTATRYDSPNLSRSQSGRSLFPYDSSIPRGTASPSRLDSATKRSYSALEDQGGSPAPRTLHSNGNSRGPSNLSTVPAYNFVPSPLRHQRQSSVVRHSSPLNPRLTSISTNNRAINGDMMSGSERAKKKQLIWDPESGFVSREELEREKEREREATLPKNEAERTLELLEGMGRTPLGETQRRSIYQNQVHVPIPFIPVASLLSSTSRQSQPPPSSPYARRPAPSSDLPPNNTTPREGPGLSSVFRAREERRKAREDADRAEREERERERMEDENRLMEREDRRRVRRDERERVMELEREEEEEEVPKRRTTRSMGKATPTKPTIKSPTKSSRRGRSSKKTMEESHDEMEEDVVAVVPTPSKRSKRVKSPTPVLPSVIETISPPPAPTPVFQQAAAASSLRPGRTHSSRAHVTSSRVFSAREEDLPPVDESELGKIKLPPMVFPAGFSFGEVVEETSKTAVGLASKTKETAPVVETKTTNSFAKLEPKVIAPAPTPAAASAIPAFSFSAPSAPPAPIVKPAASNFFSQPPPAAPASISPVSPFPSTAGAKVPNFFGTTTPAVLPPSAPFTFGAKPTVAPFADSPTPSADTTPVAPATNPFAAFGKPMASIIAEEESKTGASNTVLPAVMKPAPAPFSFGAATPAPASTTPSFSFGAPSPATAAPSPFAFNAPPAPTPVSLADMPSLTDDQDEDSGMEDHSSAPPAAIAQPKPSFTFGPTTSTPAFGSTPSAPTPSPFGNSSLAPPNNTSFFGAPPSTTPISPFGNIISSPFGGFASSTPSPAQSPAPGGAFNFSAPPPAPAPTPAFSFGSTSNTTSNVFGGAPSAPAPFTFGAAAPALDRTASSSSSNGAFGGFGVPPPSSGGNIGFSFGGAPTNNAPFGFGSTAPASTPAFSFGGGAATPSTAAPTNFFGVPANNPTSPEGSSSLFNLGSGGEESSGAKGGGRRIAAMRKRK